MASVEPVGDDAVDTQSRARRADFAAINALSSRPAGYAVALKCLQVQADAEELDPTLKSETEVRLHPDAWSWYQGALGEIEVGKLLSALGPEWFVRHSVPIGAGTKDVDHLVIGPGGVFAINTKHHAAALIWVGDYVLRVNNSNVPHLKAARGDASDVARRLSDKVGFPVPVTPVIALFNARSITDRRPPQNRPVQVVDAADLMAWIRAQPAAFSPAKIELVKLAAEEPGTWHIDPHAADTFRVMHRFERLVARATIGSPRAALGGEVAPARRGGNSAAPKRPEKRGHPASAGRPPKVRSTRKRAADEKTIVRLWLYGALLLGVVIYGTTHAAHCATASLPSGVAGFRCTVAAGLTPLYPIGWWAAGASLLIALVMTVVHARR